jgi:hypothetical protein
MKEARFDNDEKDSGDGAAEKKYTNIEDGNHS